MATKANEQPEEICKDYHNNTELMNCSRCNCPTNNLSTEMANIRSDLQNLLILVRISFASSPNRLGRVCWDKQSRQAGTQA